MNYLKLARQQRLEPRHRPFFERFGQQRMVRVGQCPLRQIPSFIPAKLGVIQEDAHEFRHGEGGMRIVELHRHFVRQRGPLISSRPEPADCVRECASDKEIFLQEAQLFPLGSRIVGIKHAGNGFGGKRLGERADKVAATELLEVEDSGVAAAQRRSVLMVLPPYPITGRS